MCAGAFTNTIGATVTASGCRNPGCQRTRREGSEYCLGHDPKPKDYQQFMEGLFRELNDPAQLTLNAEGWIFPSDENGIINLSKEFSKPVMLQNAKFSGDVYFKAAKFLGNADFEGAHFEGDADFTAAEFAEDESISKTSFDGAHFQKEARFEGTCFAGTASFVGAHFKNIVKMSAATIFKGEARFNGTQFKGETTMSEATFEGNVEFKSGASFKQLAKFVSTKFKGQALFENAKFADLVDFSRAEFSLFATFKNSLFRQPVEFTGTVFYSGGDVSFENTKFKGSVSFDEKCKFQRSSYFTRTEFAQDVKFDETEFEQSAHFEKTIFNDVNFAAVKFKQTAKFVLTRFNGWSQFSTPEFYGETIFEHPQFTQLTILDGAIFGTNANFNVQVNERNRLAVRNSDLSKVKFVGSNVENIEFQDCKWIETGFYRWKIADEPDAGPFERIKKKDKDLKEARRLYRQLRLNHDKAGQYEIAGRFYASESEMSYLLHAPVYRWIHPRGLYKWASKYGESIVQAGVGMLALVLLFAGFYYFFSTRRPIWFRETPKMLGTPPLITLSWWESVWLSLQASKPLADLGLSPKTIPYWVVLAQGFIVPTQIGLFLLAIRRRFRRGD
jgi:uncharacterized protein YjbI with pentapeptide repeats